MEEIKGLNKISYKIVYYISLYAGICTCLLFYINLNRINVSKWYCSADGIGRNFWIINLTGISFFIAWLFFRKKRTFTNTVLLTILSLIYIGYYFYMNVFVYAAIYGVNFIFCIINIKYIDMSKEKFEAWKFNKQKIKKIFKVICLSVIAAILTIIMLFSTPIIKIQNKMSSPEELSVLKSEGKTEIYVRIFNGDRYSTFEVIGENGELFELSDNNQPKKIHITGKFPIKGISGKDVREKTFILKGKFTDKSLCRDFVNSNKSIEKVILPEFEADDWGIIQDKDYIMLDSCDYEDDYKGWAEKKNSDI